VRLKLKRKPQIHPQLELAGEVENAIWAAGDTESTLKIGIRNG